MKSQRILCVIGKMDSGGAETMLMKLFRVCKMKEIIFDFVVFTDEEGFYDDEIRALGGNIYQLGKRNPFIVLLRYIMLLRRNKYDFLIQSTEQAHRAILALIAKCCGAKKIIIRSTNSKTGRGILVDLLELTLRWIPNLAANVKIAPSIQAGNFLFGTRSKYSILHNGINTNEYKFDDNVCDEYRKKLNVQDKFVVGHIGRFEKQKNHIFLIKVFREILKIRPQSVLVLVGSGSLKSHIKQMASDLGISSKIIFLERRNDIPKLMMAMDVMIFPSLYEGMPNVVIEAQTTGLPCLVSDTVTDDCGLTNKVKFLSLKQMPSTWAESACDVVEDNYNRHDSYKQIKAANYDIEDVANEFLNLFYK